MNNSKSYVKDLIKCVKIQKHQLYRRKMNWNKKLKYILEKLLMTILLIKRKTDSKN
jgi:hypothetical protein